MQEETQNIKNEFFGQIIEAKTLKELEGLKNTFLGRQGKLSKLIKKISESPSEERAQIGALINETKQTLEKELRIKTKNLSKEKEKWFDPTIPVQNRPYGSLHLVTQAIEEISDIFKGIGFTRARYPEVEWDYFAFTSLNFPENHPARDEWETFWVNTPEHKEYGPMVLTPHTSSGQVREMKRLGEPPIRMINIAKCYRRQSDVSHTPMFHQFEGLVVDENISIANLKGTLDYFAKTYFGENRTTRLRPYDFVFTEPSFEVDISCGVCDGKGCKLCKEGWLEIGGSGMVHPEVLKHGGIDPKKYTGFAFGWGVERVLMMRSGINIDDLRTLYSSDIRFLKQF